MPIDLEIQAFIDQYVDSYNRRDLAGLEKMYAENASLFSPYGPAAIGNAAILETHSEWFDEDEQNKRMTLVEAQVSEGLGYCVVRYAGDYPDGSGNLVTESGVSVNVLKRSSRGNWQFQVTSLTSDTPAPE